MATADPGSVDRTGNAYVDSLLWGDRWDQSSGPITYEFWRLSDTFAWTSPEKAAFRTAIESWTSVAKLTIRETPNKPTDLNFLLAELDEIDPRLYAIQAGPNGGPYDGLGGYDRENFKDWFGQLRPGGFAYSTIVHELGHALGLAHPHDRATGWSTIFPGVTPDDAWDTGSYGLNTWLYTVMSYNNYGEWWAPGEEAPYGFVAGPMAFDIAAIQHIYGANMATGAGSNSYALPGANRVGTAYRCIWDAGGTDTIAYSGSRDATIDLRDAPLTGRYAGGYLSRAEGVLGGFTIANGVVIENAYGGSGDDRLTGNAADNRLYGGRGADLMSGGSGNDTYSVDHTGDRIVEGSRGGFDTVLASIDHVLAVNVERLLLTGSAVRGTGNAAANLLTGNAAANTLDGAAGDDLLDGAAGDDLMRGGSGNDTLLGGAGRDRLDGGSGLDAVSYEHSSRAVQVDLGRGVGSGGDAHGDRLDSIEAVVGSRYHDRLTGAAGRDLIAAGAGNDIVKGGPGHDLLRGGAGIDRLYGGDGADSLAGEADADRLHGDGGSDRLYGGDGRNLLFGGDGIDRLYADSGIGSLYGGNGVDLLYGGDGADRLSGDLGSDRAYGGNGNDAVYGGQGDDSLFGGSGNDRLDGGDGGDFLYGGAGHDLLIGGAGNDSLDGGQGNDRLDVGSGRDRVSGGSGIDTAVLPEDRADYAIDRTDPARVVLRHGSDVATLVDVEYLRFADRMVSNRNHAPASIADVDADVDRVAEGAANGTAVGITARSLDIDGDRLTYRLVDDAGGLFRIGSATGIVTVADGQRLDHESDASHTVLVRASDRYGLFAERSFVIAVGDEDEPPGGLADVDAAANEVREDAPAGTAVGITASAFDPEGDVLTFTLTDDAGGRFAVDEATGIVVLADGGLLDHESAATHEITVRVQDPLGAWIEAVFAISVLGTEELPA